MSEPSVMESDGRLDTTAAEGLASRLYGLRADASPLPSYVDQNFHLRVPDGDGYVLKVVAAGGEAPLELPVAALAHVAREAPELNTPRPLPTMNRQLLTRLTAGGRAYDIALLTFVPGDLLANIPARPTALLAGLGRYLGDLDRALAGFDHPAARRSFRWALPDAGWVDDALGIVPAGSRREVVAHFIGRFRENVRPRLAGLPWAVIHNDANDHNVVVKSGSKTGFRVIALLDFGDVVHSPRLAEPAIAAAYAMLEQREPVEAAAAVVSGYHARLPLLKDEVALLYDAIATRLCVSVVNAASERALQPENRYVAVTEAAAWEALLQWRELAPGVVTGRFYDACAAGRRIADRVAASGESAR